MYIGNISEHLSLQQHSSKNKKYLHKNERVIKIKWLCYIMNQKKVHVNLNI